MTQVTQLIIKPSGSQQTRNLVLAIIDIAKKREASAETMRHIQALAAEAIAMMDDSRQQSGKGTKRRGF
ncbi:hypothetical protein O3W44_01585 [Pantoea sp. LMR881]|uniref:hypothetical protein n=1 Tax=Pantoea sp. LMR881 TaxID=3014336 RepID=UPI0022AF9854|nr:hypothetical protein [Pantoea sp. LMR881]MCZ4057817.1 hypothetical protein [Pantoea sp. LMR881]MCZ4058061.1 hypothetical protein [Pantoea sp. LMR881]